MEKGYYGDELGSQKLRDVVAIHNKNGKGLLPYTYNSLVKGTWVAIHNKNGKGLLQYEHNPDSN